MHPFRESTYTYAYEQVCVRARVHVCICRWVCGWRGKQLHLDMIWFWPGILNRSLLAWVDSHVE